MGFSASKFNYDEDYKRLGLAGTFLSSNPDLRRFRQAGGKLLIVQGGNDVTEQARSEIDYFEMVERVMGGAEETRGFARLFLVPGMNHGSGGDGAFAIDYLSAMERWVADQGAPDVLVGAHVPEWGKRLCRPPRRADRGPGGHAGDLHTAYLSLPVACGIQRPRRLEGLPELSFGTRQMR